MGQSLARIALLVDLVESDYQLDIIQGVRRVASRAGARLVIVAGGALPAAGTEEARNFVYRWLSDARIDGAILLSGCLSNSAGMDALPPFVAELGRLPVVTIGAAVAGVPGVSVDNLGGFRNLIRHQIEVHGAKRWAMVTGPARSSEARLRAQGFEQALTAAGIDLATVHTVPGGLVREGGLEAAELLFGVRGIRPNQLDAIACVNDESALGVLESLQRRGVTVPRPVALLGFDDAPATRLANPSLTTVSQRVREQGEAAAQMLLEYLERGTPLRDHILEAPLVIRESCGCRPRAQNASHALTHERPKVARSLRLALIERRGAILRSLEDVASGRIVAAPGWEGHLIDALAAQVDSEEGGAFLWEFERLARQHSVQGGDAIVCHEVLTELRLQALVCSEVQPTLRTRLEDIFQESRLSLGRVASSVAREHQIALNQRLRSILVSCLEQVGRPDWRQLQAALAEQLPLLGVSSYCVSKWDETSSELRVVLASNSATKVGASFPLKTLGHDESLEKASTTIVFPLTYLGVPQGVAVFSWGSIEPLAYEQWRELLGLALAVSAPTSSLRLQAAQSPVS
jgi:DNA-binding LacI/PurR family transcriptional regulator